MKKGLDVFVRRLEAARSEREPERKAFTMWGERGSDEAGYLGWFLLGAVAGVAAALLTAPKSGRETRELLAERGGDWFKKAQDAADDTQSRAGDIFDRGREYFEEQTQRLASAFEAGRTAMKEEIDRGQSGA